MAGNTAAITLASNALVLLGHQSISSFSEPTAGAQVAENLYEHSYKYLMSLHRWRFATKQMRLVRLAAKPESIFEHQHQLPPDLIYLIRPINVLNYEVYNTKLYSNHLDVTIEYVYDVGESNLPPYFAKALEFYLASQFAIPITGDIDKATYYSREYEKMMIKAKALDSSQRPSSPFTYSPYANGRT